MKACLGEDAKTGGLGSTTAEGRLLSHNGAGYPGRENPECSESEEAPGEETRLKSVNIVSLLRGSCTRAGVEVELTSSLPGVCCSSPALLLPHTPSSGVTVATGESLPPCGHYSSDSCRAQDIPAELACSVLFTSYQCTQNGVSPGLSNPRNFQYDHEGGGGRGEHGKEKRHSAVLILKETCHFIAVILEKSGRGRIWEALFSC